MRDEASRAEADAARLAHAKAKVLAELKAQQAGEARRAQEALASARRQLRHRDLARAEERRLLLDPAGVGEHDPRGADPRGEGDLCELITKEVPGQVFCSMLGITDRDQIQYTMDAAEQFACWNDPEYAHIGSPLALPTHTPTV